MRRKAALSGVVSIALIPVAIGSATATSSEPDDRAERTAVVVVTSAVTKPKPPRDRDPKRVYRSDSPFRFGTARYSKWYARQFMYKRFGWRTNQYRALELLWSRESGWSHRARNPRSGAFGIPQALPAGKMRSAGRDWATNPETQIRWGLSYIRGRFGTPERAYAFFRAHNWY